ncbi:MAG: acetyl-CoA carboxylase biotin carboxyl carrier protein subunit [Bacteroidota bacterium]|jgi:biotin carboxyl carrier protein
MYKIKINKNTEFEVEKNNEKNNSWFVNNNLVNIDLAGEKNFHILLNNKSYNAEIVDKNAQEKTFKIKVNGTIYETELKDKMDFLLQSMGLDTLNSKKINEIKAPMPGMVLDIKVNEGSTVKKGDVLIVLEAMKMENNLKSPSDGIVKKIVAKKGTAVEKNQLLISFE